MIEIDGSYKEGGGQILRTATALSCVTGLPCKINNIRKGRPQPGLKPQHIVGVRSLAELFSAGVTGDFVGSTEITFVPGKSNFHDMRIDVGTAGSVSLILQTLLPLSPVIKRAINLDVSGGTHVEWSPPYEHTERVLLPILSRMGLQVETEMNKVGFYPKGGGMVRAKIGPGDLKPLLLPERDGNPLIRAISIASKSLMKARVAERQLDGAKRLLDLDDALTAYVDAVSPGSCLFIEASFDNTSLGSCALGSPCTPAEKVGTMAAKGLKAELDTGCTVDIHLADQLIPFMAMAPGDSSFISSAMTGHMETNIWTVKKFLDVDFDVKRVKNGFEIKTKNTS